MTHKIGVKGQVVIPKAIRDRIGIQPGDEVVFEASGDEVRIRRMEDAEEMKATEIRTLRGVWSDQGTGTDALAVERRHEREAEERKAERHGVGRL
jgi:AbrB family looped-hinge helix DNA binding protein